MAGGGEARPPPPHLPLDSALAARHQGQAVDRAPKQNARGRLGEVDAPGLRGRLHARRGVDLRAEGMPLAPYTQGWREHRREGTRPGSTTICPHFGKRRGGGVFAIGRTGARTGGRQEKERVARICRKKRPHPCSPRPKAHRVPEYAVARQQVSDDAADDGAAVDADAHVQAAQMESDGDLRRGLVGKQMGRREGAGNGQQRGRMDDQMGRGYAFQRKNYADVQVPKINSPRRRRPRARPETEREGNRGPEARGWRSS